MAGGTDRRGRHVHKNMKDKQKGAISDRGAIVAKHESHVKYGTRKKVLDARGGEEEKKEERGKKQKKEKREKMEKRNSRRKRRAASQPPSCRGLRDHVRGHKLDADKYTPAAAI